jgi:hypothetical protein
MKPRVVKSIYRWSARRAARSALVGRLRDREHQEEGRFTREEVAELLRQTWTAYDQLAPHVPREPTIGSRMNLLLAAMTLAFLQVLIARGTSRAYAIELVGDVAWKIYERWGQIPGVVARLRSRDPSERMRVSVELFLRFPFTPPGYRFDRLPSEEGISLDMLRCPVAEYFRREEASDLCIGTWCNLDYPLAEMWGGWLERTQTLAAGCDHCDFRFKADRPDEMSITGVPGASPDGPLRTPQVNSNPTSRSHRSTDQFNMGDMQWC